MVVRNSSYVLGSAFYDSTNNTTIDMSTGQPLKNNPLTIANVKQQLNASDVMLKYDYFETQKAIQTVLP